MWSINKNLITLKCVLFLFFAGVGCFFPFLPVHIKAIGFSTNEAIIISIVAPFFALLGPLLVGPLADKFSVGRGCETQTIEKSGATIQNNTDNRVLRFLIALCIVGAALFYALLMTVPYIQPLQPRRPSVNFMCNGTSAIVYQEMCSDESICHNWSDQKSGLLELSKCQYACEKSPMARAYLYDTTSTTESTPEEEDEEDIVDEDNSPIEVEAVTEDDENLGHVDYKNSGVEPPHICHSKEDGVDVLCQVFMPFTKTMVVHAGLMSGIEYQEDMENENETAWCMYPLSGSFQCEVPKTEIAALIARQKNPSCRPIIECNVVNPYDSPESVLAESQCRLFDGDPVASFWAYLIFRTLGDIFATAALCLLCTACVIATRETSVGRGDVGQQLAFGVIGMALIPPIVGLIHEAVADDTSLPPYIVPILSMMILFMIAAIFMLFSKEMPLTPPEWWWHTKSGMLALPMNTVRRYGLETAGVVLVLIALGVFWSGLDTYLAWTITYMHGSDLLIALTVTIGSIPAIPVLWKAERLVDYFGHSNVFIGAFTFYIIRYTGMAVLDDPMWVLLCEVFEVFTLSLMWVTAVLYFRHLVPRKYTSTGQALPVIAHFCIGRGLGALIGLTVKYGEPVERLQLSYVSLAISACVIGVLYLIVYHLLLAPLCRASTTGPPNPTVMQGMNANGNSNGSYTPLRVYHNERAKKGQFKY